MRLCRPMSGDPLAHRRGLFISRGSASAGEAEPPRFLGSPRKGKAFPLIGRHSRKRRLYASCDTAAREGFTPHATQPVAKSMIEIRSATDSDKPAIWQIIKAVISTGETYVFHPDTSEDEMLDYWFAA